MSIIINTAVPWIMGLIGYVLLDLVWIGWIASDFYKSRTAPLLNMVEGNMVVNIPAALATWAVIVTGIQLFVFARASATGPLVQVAFWGAVFGAVIYAVYDLTNYTLLRGWPLTVTVVDILWGAVACSLTSCLMALTTRAVERLF